MGARGRGGTTSRRVERHRKLRDATLARKALRLARAKAHAKGIKPDA